MPPDAGFAHFLKKYKLGLKKGGHTQVTSSIAGVTQTSVHCLCTTTLTMTFI